MIIFESFLNYFRPSVFLHTQIIQSRHGGDRGVQDSSQWYIILVMFLIDRDNTWWSHVAFLPKGSNIFIGKT